MGAQRFAIRDIARQAAVSDATVDRVLHDRGGVKAGTAARVRRAIAELERHQEAFELGGRTFTVDLVMHSPHRFSAAVWSAFQDAAPALRPAAFKLRPHIHERIEPTAIADILDTIGGDGSHAVILKAPDTDEIVDAVGRLGDRGIPVITIVTDLPTSHRIAYVGIDNRAAGSTAAYLIDRWLPSHAGTGTGTDRPTVLVTVSSHQFRGEEEREIGFRRTARTIAPTWQVIDLAETEGLDDTIAHQIDGIADSIHVDAVYSIGGGNRAAIETLTRHGQRPRVYLAHDLDRDNRQLLTSGHISAVLHHDLRTDARRACHLVMQAHDSIPGRPRTEPETVQIITPYNIPANTPT